MKPWCTSAAKVTVAFASNQIPTACLDAWSASAWTAGCRRAHHLARAPFAQLPATRPTSAHAIGLCLAKGTFTASRDLRGALGAPVVQPILHLGLTPVRMCCMPMLRRPSSGSSSSGSDPGSPPSSFMYARGMQAQQLSPLPMGQFQQQQLLQQQHFYHHPSPPSHRRGSGDGRQQHYQQRNRRA